MKKPYFLILASALAFSFHAAEARQEKPDINDTPLQEQPLQLPNYDQFRQMSEEKQMAYLHDIRKMLVDLSATGVQVSSLFDYVQPTSSWATLFGLIRNASAADCKGRNFWTHSSGRLCTTGYVTPICGDDAVALATECKTEYNNSMQRLQDRLGRKAETNADDQSQRIQQSQQIDEANKEVAQATAAKTAAANANPTGAGGPTTKPSFIKEPFSSNSTADTNQDKKPKKFRCIYAGFTVYGDDCKPPDKYVDPKTNSVYTCKPTEGDKDYGILTPAKPDPKKTVLCNPVFFGTVPNGPGSNGSYPKQEPICVAKGKNATADCLTGANADKNASLKSAVKFAKDDKAKYQELTDTIATLCAGDASPATSSMSASSKKDLSDTCIKYRDRMKDYQPAYEGSGAAAVPAAK